jgi:hypothetical protein
MAGISMSDINSVVISELCAYLKDNINPTLSSEIMTDYKVTINTDDYHRDYILLSSDSNFVGRSDNFVGRIIISGDTIYLSVYTNNWLFFDIPLGDPDCFEVVLNTIKRLYD